MIVDSKWLSNNAKVIDYTTCSKCGGESKKIITESAFTENKAFRFKVKKMR